MLTSLWRNRALIWALTRRDIDARYRGSFLGLFWSFFHPLFMLAVYTFVFSVVFKARWSGGSDSRTEFALVLFAGLLVFNLFAECVGRASGLILANANYVKKVVFPLEILPWTVLGATFFHSAVSIVVWLGAYILLVGVPHPTALLVPLVFAPLGLFVMGCIWFLASLGVFLRDTAQIVAIMTTVLMFLSPIFYPVSALPEGYRTLLWLNPLLVPMEAMRNVLFWGQAPAWGPWGAFCVVSVIWAWLGFAWFQHTRKGFADVL